MHSYPSNAKDVQTEVNYDYILDKPIYSVKYSATEYMEHPNGRMEKCMVTYEIEHDGSTRFKQIRKVKAI